ncbi:MAG: ATP-binding protein, partial [bacterium]|nr:ATP-binding protein [Candidatus Minthenecus merdequi]
KSRLNAGKTGNAYFFRDSNGNEIDLVVDEGGILDTYEIKSSMTFNTSFNAMLEKTDSLLTTKVRGKTVIYAGDLENRDGKIRLLNWRNF